MGKIVNPRGKQSHRSRRKGTWKGKTVNNSR